MILLALLQAAATPAPVTRATSAAPAASFSILVDPCGRASGKTVGNDVVVCGATADPRRLPLPDERQPDHAVPFNPDLTATAALAAESTPCAAIQKGCTVGIGGPLLFAAIKGIATAVSDGAADRKVRKARKADAGQRVPIPLD